MCVLVEINVLVGCTSSGNFCSEHDDRGCLARCFPTAGTGKGLGGKNCLRAFSLIFYFVFVPLLDTQTIFQSSPNLPEIHGSLSTGSIRLKKDTPNVALVIKNILTFLPLLLNTTILGRKSRHWPLCVAWAWRNHPGDSAHGRSKRSVRVPTWQVVE